MEDEVKDELATPEDTNLPALSTDANDELNRKLRAKEIGRSFDWGLERDGTTGVR